MTEVRAPACDAARLSAYRDGELSPPERQEVAAHVAACETCRQRLRDYATLAAVLSEPNHAPPILVTRAALRTRLETPSRAGWWVRSRSGATVAATAALAVVMGVGALGGFPWSPRSGLVAPGASALAAVPAQTPAPAGPDRLRSERLVADTAAASQCAQPLPSVSLVLSQRPNVQGVLGCATDAARVLGVTAQSFERGSLLRRSDTRVVYAVTEDGRWRQYADASPRPRLVNLTDTASAGLPVRAGRMETADWFQGLWTDRPELSRLLGGAVDDSQQSQGLVQTFEGGVALWDGRGRVFVLMSTGESLQFQDQRAARQQDFLRPLPIPTLEASTLTEDAAL